MDASVTTSSSNEKQAELLYYAHVAVMIHGEMVCTASRPRCESCPLKDRCAYFLSRTSLVDRSRTPSPITAERRHSVVALAVKSGAFVHVDQVASRGFPSRTFRSSKCDLFVVLDASERERLKRRVEGDLRGRLLASSKAAFEGSFPMRGTVRRVLRCARAKV